MYLIDNNHALDDESPQTQSAPKVVCINGMMRTGSSALTRGLGALGLYLGGQIQKSEARVNPTGFWEDAQVYDALHRVYRAIGLGDHMSATAANIPANRWDRPKVKAIAAKLARYMQQTIAQADGHIVAIKNPSISRLMPFWMRMVKLVPCNDCYIVTIRSPKAVAESCRRAWNFSRELSDALWVQFTIGSLMPAAAGRAAIAVDYDQFMRDPSATLHRIAQWLDVSFTTAVRASVKDFSANFIRSDLRHFIGSSKATTPKLPKQIYELLQKAALAYEPLESEEFQMRWRSLAPQMTTFTRHLDEIDAKRHKVLAKRICWRGRSAIKDTLARAKARAAGRIR